MRDETIYDILKREHETVQGILDKLDETTAPAARAHLFERLKSELQPHMHAEEIVLYAALKAEEESRETSLAAREEHRAATHVLHELERLSPENELWKARFHVLKESIEHHVEEEEGPLFKKAKQVLDKEDAVEIGKRYLATKREYIAERDAVRATGTG